MFTVMRRLLFCSAMFPLLSGAAAAQLFTAPRENPFRRVDDPPAVANDVAFSGTARPGEFFVFQIGVKPLADTGPLLVRFAELQSDGGAIPAELLTCLSLEGTGHDGRPLAKQIHVPAGAVQILWCGVDVPKTAAGEYRGRIEVGGGPTALGTVQLTLEIEGRAVDDRGDSVAENLSRLRWLNSTVGSEPTITRPFVPVEAGDRTVRVLGRELTLGENGLPTQINSFFNGSNTQIVAEGRPVLAAPISFVVETEAGPLRWTNRFGRLERDDLNARWSAQCDSPAAAADVAGSLDYTGSGRLTVTLRAKRDLAVKDIRLEVPQREPAARYFMGLNRRGGRRPDEPIAWTWDVAKRQDCFWMGDVNAGLMLRFKGSNYVRPLVNIYYKFLPLNLPESWGNEGRGGIHIGAAVDGVVNVRAYSGARTLKAGQTLTFTAELYLTPFRPLDTEKQWSVRFFHPHVVRNAAFLRDALAKMDPADGANVLNIHQAQYAAPYINYPYADDSFPELARLIEQGHEKGVKVRVYYTTREVTQNMPELFALHSMNGEMIFPGPGPDARTLIHPNGPHAWLTENLGDDFVPAWVDHLRRPGAEWDLSVITRPDSRWNNFYLQGLKWMVARADLDGVYIDDAALDARSLRRARRILDTKPGRLIDLHTWNHFNGWAGYANNLTIYMEFLPYLDRLWIGEGFHCDGAAWDYWLVEMSGLPFGLMGEMLDRVSPWRGLVFGETGRHGWAGDPRPIWKAWDEFGIQGTQFMPFCAPDCPVRTGRDDVLATVYRGEGRTLVAVASWADRPCEIVPTIDWAALGLDPAKSALYAPPIAGFQAEGLWKPGEALVIEPGRGFLLVLDQTPRRVADPAELADVLAEVFHDPFNAPVLMDGWNPVKTAKTPITIAVSAGALRIDASANVHGGVERQLPKGVRAVQVQLDGGTDGGQTWGPGVALVWPGGRTAKINLRMENGIFGLFAGDGLRMTGGPIARERPETVRIVLDAEHVYFQAKTGERWRLIDKQSRNGLAGDPTALRLGKLAENGSWQDHGGEAGARGQSAYRDLRVLGK